MKIVHYYEISEDSWKKINLYYHCQKRNPENLEKINLIPKQF